jgi:hypothetical protein
LIAAPLSVPASNMPENRLLFQRSVEATVDGYPGANKAPTALNVVVGRYFRKEPPRRARSDLPRDAQPFTRSGVTDARAVGRLRPPHKEFR